MLTTEQLATLKAAIEADSALAAIPNTLKTIDQRLDLLERLIGDMGGA